MDPFTQRMLERARARQEKIDQKLANSGQAVPKRIPLSENIIKTESSVLKSPAKTSRTSITSPRKSTEPTKAVTPVKTVNRRSSIQKSDQLMVASPQRRNDVIVTKKEFNSPRRGSIQRRNSDVSVEINISHRNDIQIEVQVEERDAPISVVYDSQACGGNLMIKEIEEAKSDDASSEMEKVAEDDHRSEKTGLRNNFKSRLDRLGNLYSDNPQLSSPIHRTESNFHSETPPAPEPAKVAPAQGKKKFGRLAALADQINNWEDDLTHHSFNPEPVKKSNSKAPKADAKEKLEASTLDVSIHSLNDITKTLQTSKQITKPSHFKNQVNECQRLQRQIVAELESEGYRRVSASQSRLVYDFAAPKPADPDRQEPKCASTTPSAAAAPKMATLVATGPVAPVTKKPSLKKYKAPTPPGNVQTETDEECESEKDKENNLVQPEENDNDATNCKQTKPEPADKPILDKGSPIIKRLAPKLNGNVDRTSVLSKAAMFESGSPKAKDPAEMSLRERKALFEKNKGAAIVPKAPFGQAPSAKTLYGDNKAEKPKPNQQRTSVQQRTPTKSTSSNSSRSNSKEELPYDNVSQSSFGGGIKGKLQALFSKEQTISESTIANKFKQEREKEMEMLQNRFHCKPPQQKEQAHESDEEQSDTEPSDEAPLMKSTTSLNTSKKPEIVANVPKVTFEKTKSETALHKEAEEKVIGSQPVKRRSSQDSPVVLSVVEDVKRIKVNNKQTNGEVLQQPRIYPHLSDIETDNSHEEYSDCGGSSAENIPQKISQNDLLNKSDNWAETSFGREVMNVVKKNNSSYRKAVRESDSESSENACDSELDDMLDEALAEESEGPTPPKLNKMVPSASVFSSQTLKYPQMNLSARDSLSSINSSSSSKVVSEESVSPLKSELSARESRSPSSTCSPLSSICVDQELNSPLKTELSARNSLSSTNSSTLSSIVNQKLKSLIKTELSSRDTRPLANIDSVIFASAIKEKRNSLLKTDLFPRDSRPSINSPTLSSTVNHKLNCLLKTEISLPSNLPWINGQSSSNVIQMVNSPPKSVRSAHNSGLSNSTNNGLSSSSFVYQEQKFKSPLKVEPVTPAGRRDKGAELVHSVSFYRRMQNASSTPTTPMRVVRHHSPDREPATPDEPAGSVTTVRQRIKELQNEISKQQTVISQASQALNLCAATVEFSGSTEQAEGERLLLLATHRRSACVQEMQRLQVEGAGCAATAGGASLHVHGLSVPLRRDYIRQLNADGAVGHHAVCLVKCRDRVLATSMQQTQPTSTLLHFPDEIQMQGLTSDFKVTVEVYLLQASKELLPHDVKYHIFSKKSSSKHLTPKSKSASLKTPAVQSPAGPHAVRSPQFQLYGYCIFALPQANRKNFTLNKVPAASPLEGTINIDIKARVHMSAPAPHCAFLTAFDDVSGLGAWHRRWFKLQAPRLAYWKYPDDVHKKMPIGDIDLSTVVSEKAIRAPRDLCARPHTLLLETSVPPGLIVPDGGSLVYVRRDSGVVRRHLLAADTATDRDLWLDRINAALEYVRCSTTDDE